MTKMTARAICQEWVTTNAPPARPSMRKISSGAYATDESASLAKIGRARRFGRRVSPSRSLRMARPRTRRLRTRPEFATRQLYDPWACAPGAVRLRVPYSQRVHFVIMGCGRVGSTLAKSLSKRGHDVAIIDAEPAAFRRLGSSFEGMTVTGIGFDRDTLKVARIDEAYAFAAVSSGDNSNILAARVARETFGVEHVAARIYDPGRAMVYQRLGIPTVATVRWTSDQMLQLLLPQGSVPALTDPSGRVVVAQVPLARSWVGRRLTEVEGVTGSRIAFITRLGDGLIPRPDTVFQDGDQIHVVAAIDDLGRIEKVYDQPPPAH